MQLKTANRWLCPGSGQLFLALASTVILGSKSWKARDHILLSHESSSHEITLRVDRLVQLLLALASTVILGLGSVRTHGDIFLFKLVFWNGTSSSTRRGVWLLLVTPLLMGVIGAGTHTLNAPLPTHTHKHARTRTHTQTRVWTLSLKILVQSSPVNCCWPSPAQSF
jgi:hypothetical protein